MQTREPRECTESGERNTMDLMSKIGVIMAVVGMLTTVLGVIVQLLAMALEEIL